MFTSAAIGWCHRDGDLVAPGSGPSYGQVDGVKLGIEARVGLDEDVLQVPRPVIDVEAQPAGAHVEHEEPVGSGRGRAREQRRLGDLASHKGKSAA